MDHQQEDKQPCEDQCQVEHSQTPFPATVPRVSKGEKRKACLDQVRSPCSPNLCNDGREPIIVGKETNRRYIRSFGL